MSDPDWMADMRAKAEAATPKNGLMDFSDPDVAEFTSLANPQTVLWLLDLLAEMAAPRWDDAGDPDAMARYEAGPGGAA